MRMILQGLSIDFLVRLMSLDRRGDDDSWLLFGPEPPAPAEDESELRWAAE
jgi:hypothetical protein